VETVKTEFGARHGSRSKTRKLFIDKPTLGCSRTNGRTTKSATCTRSGTFRLLVYGADSWCLSPSKNVRRIKLHLTQLRTVLAAVILALGSSSVRTKGLPAS